MATQRSGQYGSGTKRERRPGVWQLRVYSGLDPVSDRPRQVTRTFRGSETAANKALAKLVSDVSEGKIESTTATVGQLLDAWLDQIEPTRALSTMQEYRRKVRLSIRPALGSIVLGGVVLLLELGSPTRAWRGVLRIRTSWLSRGVVLVCFFVLTGFLSVAPA